MFVIICLCFTNLYYTAYLPTNLNRVYDNTGALYGVSRAINGRAIFDAARYEARHDGRIQFCQWPDRRWPRCCWELCIMPNVGESVGWLAKWEVVRCSLKCLVSTSPLQNKKLAVVSAEFG